MFVGRLQGRRPVCSLCCSERSPFILTHVGVQKSRAQTDEAPCFQGHREHVIEAGFKC